MKTPTVPGFEGFVGASLVDFMPVFIFAAIILLICLSICSFIFGLIALGRRYMWKKGGSFEHLNQERAEALNALIQSSDDPKMQKLSEFLDKQGIDLRPKD